MRNKLALVVAVVLGLIAVYGVSHVIKKTEEKYTKGNPVVRVAAASERIPAGTVLLPEMLLVERLSDGTKLPGIEIPQSAVQQGQVLIGDEDRLVGLPINITVERGQQLMWSYFRRPVERLEQKLRRGERAVTLRVDAITGVADNLTPDARVDIIGTFPLAQAAGARGAQAAGAAASRTLLLLSNVTVLAVDNRTHEEEYVSPTGGMRAKGYSSVTVSVTQEEANMLVFAQQYGTLTLALRSPADSTPAIGATEINGQNLLDMAAKDQEARQQRLKDVTPIRVTPRE